MQSEHETGTTTVEPVEVARALAARLGVTLVDKTPEEQGSNWNGKVLAGCQSSDNIIHDLAHWMVAPKSRRGAYEFGLGSSPDVFCSKAIELVSDAFGQREEEHASLLGIIIERHFGHDWRHTWRFHSWKAYDHKVFERLRWLVQNGLVTTSLIPTFSTVKVKTHTTAAEVSKATRELLDDYARTPASNVL